MLTIRTMLSTLSAPVLLAASSMAQAGSITVFDFSLLAAPAPVPPPVTATPVPVLSDALLVVLGLLLVVIAIRTLRSNRAAHKLLSAVILAGGLLVGGMGVEPAVATVADIVFGDGEGERACEDMTDIEYHYDPTVINNCESSAKVSPRIADSHYPECYDLVGGDCDVLASGESCTLPTSVLKDPPPQECEF